MCYGRITAPRTWPPPLRSFAGVNDDLAEPMSMTSSRPARRFDWKKLGLRATSATILIPAVVAAIFVDWLFLVLIAVSVALLAIEWAFMTTPRAGPRVATAISVAVMIPL